MLNDKVEFYLDAKLYKLIESYSIKYDLFKGSADFEAEIDHDTEILLAYRDTRPLDYAWYINGFGVLSGYVDTGIKEYSKNNIIQKIKARDYLQVLIDNHVLKAQSFDSFRIDTIINSVLNNNKSVTVSGATYYIPNFDLNYTTDALTIISNVGPLVTFKTTPGETLYEVICKLINPIGLYIYNIPGTQTFTIAVMNINGTNYDKFGYAKITAPFLICCQDQNQSGRNNILSGTYTTDNKNYYQYIRALGDPENYETETFYQLKTEKVYKCSEAVMKLKCAMINSADFNVWNVSATKDYFMNNFIFKMKKDFVTLRYVMAGHSYEGNEPYFVNSTAHVVDDLLPGILNNKDWIISAVEFRGQKTEGELNLTTALELCLPINDGKAINEKTL